MRPVRALAVVAVLALSAGLAPGSAIAASPASGGAPPAGSATPASGGWSRPATLGSCAGGSQPQAVFPREGPTHATGAGAVVWSAARECAGGEGALVAPVGHGDLPGRPAYARATSGRRLALRAPLAVTPAPHGQLVIASSGAPGASGSLVQGTAGGPFSTLGAIAGTASTNALSSGYLGDVAAAWPSGGGTSRASVKVAIERYFARTLSAPLTISGVGTGPGVQSLTVALAYRTDAIAVWGRAGAIYAHDLPASGERQSTQRLASAGARPQITALISDDHRAIVAWADERAGQTSVYLDVSAEGVRFGAPRLLERFGDPAGAPYPAGSPQLVRLSSEGVMLAWTGVQQGHWVVRAAAVDLSGAPKASTISPTGGDSLLSALATGPDDDALALWSEPQRTPQGTLDLGRRAIFAARGTDAEGGTTAFGPPEQVAAPAAGGPASAAFDPDSDRALAVWLGERGAVQYALRAAR